MAARASASASRVIITRTRLRHRPERDQIGQTPDIFSQDPLFFPRTTDRAEIAPRARAFTGTGHEEPQLDAAIDHGERFQPLPARVLVDGDLMFAEPAGSRAVEEPSRHDVCAEPLLHDGAVEHR